MRHVLYPGYFAAFTQFMTFMLIRIWFWYILDIHMYVYYRHNTRICYQTNGKSINTCILQQALMCLSMNRFLLLITWKKTSRFEKELSICNMFLMHLVGRTFRINLIFNMYWCCYIKPIMQFGIIIKYRLTYSIQFNQILTFVFHHRDQIWMTIYVIHWIAIYFL